MTTYKEICDLLTKAARKTTIYDLLAPLMSWLIYFVTAQLLFIILDHVFLFSTTSRLIAFFITFLPPILFIFYARKRSKLKLSLVYIAQQLEQQHPLLSNRLVSYLLSSHKESDSTTLLMNDLKGLKTNAFPENITMKVRTLCLIIFCGLLYAISSVQSSSLSLARLYAPTLEASMPTKTHIISIQAKHQSSIFKNDWRLIIKTKGVPPKSGILRIYKKNHQTLDIPLIQSGPNVFYCPLRNMEQQLEYSLKLGDTQTKRQKIHLKGNPLVESFTLYAILPNYLKRPAFSTKNKNCTLVEGSLININLLFDQEIKEAQIVWNNQKIPLQVNFKKLKTTTILQVDTNTVYSFRIKGKNSEQYFQSPNYTITTSKDEAPIINIQDNLKKEYKSTLTIPIRYSCQDDFAIENIELTYELRYAKIKKKITLVSKLQKSSYQGLYQLDLATLNLPSDDILNITISATDQRNNSDGTGISNTTQFRIGKKP
jgi:hypothetical protein